MTRKAINIWDNLKWLTLEARRLGFLGILRGLWDDLFCHRTLGQWLYLLALCLPTMLL